MEVLALLSTAGVGLDTIRTALTAVASLCQQMKDSKTVCTRAYERLRDILDELQKLQRSGRPLPAQSKIDKLAKLLHSFLEFLQKYVDMSLVYRLMKYNSMMDELKRINEEIDTLVALLNVSTARVVVEWREQWEQDCELQMQVLMALVDNSASVLSEVRDARAQVEAMTVLKFEFEQRASERSREMLGLLKKLYTQIVRVSKAEVPSVPSWFIPSGDVVYESSPFAQGSFGAVHFGRWNSGARVVVKTLLVDDLVGGGNRTTQSRILGEIDIWYRLHHPNVIKMYGACHVSSPPFIVCEEAGNGNMAEYLGRSPQHQSQMWRLLYQAALGLEYLHKSHVVHGDLKLNNILVGSDGTARLADFGLSSVRTSSATSTASAVQRSASGKNNQSEQSAGALRWRAPECLKGRPKFASDVYSLGMCIIEAATGEPPFAMVADDIVFQLLRHGEIPDQPDELDDEVWDLVVSMTKQQASERCKLSFVISRLLRFGGDGDAVPIELGLKSRSSTMSTTSLVSTATNSSEGTCEIDPVITTSGKTIPDAPTLLFSSMTLKVAVINQDTPISDLIATLQDSKQSQVKSALQWIYRRAYYNAIRPQIVAWGGVEPIMSILKNPKSGYHQQLYALSVLSYLREPGRARGAVTDEELEGLKTYIRDPTPSDRSALEHMLDSTHTDSERTEAIETIANLVHVKPETHGLIHLAPRIGDLVSSGDTWVSIAATNGVYVLAVLEPSCTSAMISRGVVSSLLSLIRRGTRRQSESAAETIGHVVAGNNAAKLEVAEKGGIDLLLELLKTGVGEQRMAACTALALLAHECDPNKEAIVAAGGVSLAVEVIRSGSDEEPTRAAWMLHALTESHPANQIVVAKSGVIGPLVGLLKRGSMQEKARAAVVLRNLVCDSEGFSLAVASLGALEALMEIAQTSSSDDDAKTASLSALSALAQTRSNARTLDQLGVARVAEFFSREGNDHQKIYANQILSAVRGNSATAPMRVASAKSTSVAADTRVYGGVIDATTNYQDLVSVLRGQDEYRSRSALQWLFRYSLHFVPEATVKSCGAIELLSGILKDHARHLHDRAYAFGCLWIMEYFHLSIDKASLDKLKTCIARPTMQELSHLYAMMQSTRLVEERVKAIEVFSCLQMSVGGDLGFSDFLPLFVGVAQSSDNLLSAAGCQALATLALELPESCSHMIAYGVLPVLVRGLSTSNHRTVEFSAEAIEFIADSGPDNQTRVAQAGVIPPLVAIVHRGAAELKVYGAKALGRIADGNPVNQDTIVDAGAIGPLMDLVRSNDNSESMNAAATFAYLCNKSETAAFSVVSLGAVPLLINLLRTTTYDVGQLAAATALYQLSCRTSTRPIVLHLGVREAFYHFASVATGDNVTTAQKILELFLAQE